MTSKEAITAIRELLLGKKEEFATATLVDGTKVEIKGDIAVGSEVVVLTEEGEIPAPDATHELEDGTKVSTENGLITNIDVSTKEEVEEEVVEENMEVEVEVEATEEEEKMVDEDFVKEVVETMKELMKKYDEKVEKMSSEFNELNEKFSKFASEPEAERHYNHIQEVFNDKMETRASRLQLMREIKNKNK